MPTNTPAGKGYTMPAEWDLHEATWISWPHPGCLSFPNAYEEVLPSFVMMAEEIAKAEILRINVLDAAEERTVKRLLRRIAPERMEFHHIPTNEPWCRDHGAIFVKRRQEPKLAAIDFGFNAWGYKLAPFEEDHEAARRMGEAIRVPVIDRRNFILEGGSVDVNGAGTVLTTETCLLNLNRNPGRSRGAIEQMLRDCLGVSQVLWLGDGIEGDDTDGHVDDIARFVNAHTVVATVEENEDDRNYEPLQINLQRLKQMRLKDGTPLHVLTLPMPSPIYREGLRLPASYANFYITNASVLMPAYGDANDAWAESVLKEAFPTRRVVPLDCRQLIWGLGAFHCLTQQQPAIES